MERKFLDVIPKRYLCPYCGKWHEWSKSNELGYYDSSSYKAEFTCNECLGHRNLGNYSVYFSNDYLYYSTDRICCRAKQVMKGKVLISSIQESSELPRVTFDVDFTAADEVGNYSCSDCDFKSHCNFCRLGQQGDGRHMKITFGFEFEQSDYNSIAKVAMLARREKELQEREQAIDSKERALKERKDAVASKEQVSQRPQVTENKEDTTMANNIFNMNMEFGPNKDENIASTLMGVAVKNGDSWRIYDKMKKEITDVGDMQLGNLPIFILPTTQLSEGDLIKDAGEYYFVTKVATPKTPTQTLSARTGEMKSIVPIKNVLGFSCYSKVIALSDSLNMGDDFDVEKLAIMSAMCGQTGENSCQMNQLLPLMLFKDKLGGDDDTMKLLLMSSMMTSEDDGGQMNQLLPLMLFKDKIGGDNDTTKLLLMSSMMGGNMAGSNNPLMSYLMLDAFMGKKDDKAPQDGDGDAK